MIQPEKQINAIYGAALSAIHDSHFGQLALGASDLIKHLLENKEPASQVIVDLGCGSGILAKELSEQGYTVLGVDISKQMLDIAKRKAPKAAFIQASLFDFSIPVCNVVCAIGEPINYVFGNKNDYDSVRDLFQHIFNQLKPGGYFIFDLLTTEADKMPTKKVVEKEEMTMIVQISVDIATSVLTRNMIFFTKESDFYIKHKEIHQQQLFERTKIKDILNELGFKVVVVDNYNNHLFRQGHFGFICEK
jgi:SAM-dependent methyltransferase